MSTIKELAEAEAARAEAENPDAPEGEPTPEPTPDTETPTTEPEPEPEPAPQPQPQQLTEGEIEKRYAKAQKIAERYAGQLADALGPELMADLHPSPLDTLPGFVMVAPDGSIDPAVLEPTKTLLGLNAGPDYRTHPDRQTCLLCDGWGDVLSGAKRAGNELLQCPTCGGKGYTDKEGRAVGIAAATPTPIANGTPPAPVETPYAPADPRVAALRAEGFTVLEPLHVS